MFYMVASQMSMLFIIVALSSEKVSFYFVGLYRVSTLHGFDVQVSSNIQIMEHKERYYILYLLRF